MVNMIIHGTQEQGAKGSKENDERVRGIGWKMMGGLVGVRGRKGEKMRTRRQLFEGDGDSGGGGGGRGEEGEGWYRVGDGSKRVVLSTGTLLAVAELEGRNKRR